MKHVKQWFIFLLVLAAPVYAQESTPVSVADKLATLMTEFDRASNDEIARRWDYFIPAVLLPTAVVAETTDTSNLPRSYRARDVLTSWKIDRWKRLERVVQLDRDRARHLLEAEYSKASTSDLFLYAFYLDRAGSPLALKANTELLSITTDRSNASARAALRFFDRVPAAVAAPALLDYAESGRAERFELSDIAKKLESLPTSFQVDWNEKESHRYENMLVDLMHSDRSPYIAADAAITLMQRCRNHAIAYRQRGDITRANTFEKLSESVQDDFITQLLQFDPANSTMQTLTIVALRRALPFMSPKHAAALLLQENPYSNAGSYRLRVPVSQLMQSVQFDEHNPRLLPALCAMLREMTERGVESVIDDLRSTQPIFHEIFAAAGVALGNAGMQPPNKNDADEIPETELLGQCGVVLQKAVVVYLTSAAMAHASDAQQRTLGYVRSMGEALAGNNFPGGRLAVAFLPPEFLATLQRTAQSLPPFGKRLAAEFALALRIVTYSGTSAQDPVRSSMPSQRDAENYLDGKIEYSAEDGQQAPVVSLGTGTSATAFCPLQHYQKLAASSYELDAASRLTLRAGMLLVRAVATTMSAYLSTDIASPQLLQELRLPAELPRRDCLDLVTIKDPLDLTREKLPACFVSQAYTTLDQALTDAMRRQQTAETQTAMWRASGVIELLKDYLDVYAYLQKQGLMRLNVKPADASDYAEELWDSIEAADGGDIDNPWFIVHETVTKIDLFGGDYTEEVWKRVTTSYLKSPEPLRRTIESNEPRGTILERLYVENSPGLAQVLRHSIEAKLLQLRDGLIQFSEVSRADDLLLVISQYPELFAMAMADEPTQALVGHWGELVHAYMFQADSKARDRRMLNWALTAGEIGLIVFFPVGGGLLQAVKLGGRAALWAERGIAAARSLEAIVGSSLLRVGASSPLLRTMLIGGGRMLMPTPSRLVAVGVAYVHTRSDRAHADDMERMKQLGYIVSIDGTIHWYHQRQASIDPITYEAIPAADYPGFMTSPELLEDKLAVCSQMRQQSYWAMLGVALNPLWGPTWGRASGGALATIARVATGPAPLVGTAFYWESQRQTLSRQLTACYGDLGPQPK